MAIEDPWSYRSRLTMPKLMLNAAGDQFFLPDSSRFYFDGLPGEKYLRYVPNTDHSLDASDAFETLQAFYASIATGATRPQFTWTVDRPDRITVRAATPTDARQALAGDEREKAGFQTGDAWTKMDDEDADAIGAKHMGRAGCCATGGMDRSVR
jgi:PhoPQ-activated pathogenicity-related protein